MPITPKTRQSRACKHRFVKIEEVTENGNNAKIKCSWCHMLFENIEELEAEYKRLKVPYKRVSLERYKREDIYQREYDPQNPKELREADFKIGPHLKSNRSNRLQYNSFRWGSSF